MQRFSKVFLLLVAILAVCLALGSCSANNGTAKDDHLSVAEKAEGKDQSFDGSGDAEARKLVTVISLDAETAEFETCIAWIEENTREMGGYLGSSRTNGSSDWSYEGRIGTCVVRIPAERSAEYINLLKQQVRVISETRSSEDVTGSYTDLQARLQSLTAQEQRVLALLEDAPDLDTILKLDDKLTAIRSEIERIQAELKLLENKTTYATITINLREATEQKNRDSFGERLKHAFVDSWTNFGNGWLDFFVWLVEALPTLLILGGIVAAIVLLIRHAIRKKRKQQEELRAAYMKSMQSGKE